jgi:chromosome segregation ATPase
MEHLVASDLYASYLHLEDETEKLRQQIEKASETWESQIRIAIPVWKRAVKAFQEQAKPVDEKNMEDLIQQASSPRRDDDEMARLVSLTAKPLFTLFESGTVQAKNSFEKNLFTSADEYAKKFSEISTSLHTLSGELNNKRKELEKNPTLDQKNHIAQTIGEAQKRIDEMNQEEEKQKERLSSLNERKKTILEDLKKKFSEFTEEEMDLTLPGEDT